MTDKKKPHDMVIDMAERLAARLKLYVNQLLDGSGDVVNRRTIKPLLRDSILRDAIHAF